MSHYRLTCGGRFAAAAIGLIATLCAWQTASAAAESATTPVAADDEFHFVVLGDSQFHDVATFNRMIDDLKHIQPAFVVQVGDMIEGYQNSLRAIEAEWERFSKQIAPLAPTPFIAVPGNHDLYNARRMSDPRIEAIYRERWGDTYRTFEYRNTRLVVLNTDAPGEERQIGPDQFAWLSSTLAESTAEHIIVFMHRPPAQLSNADDLHNLLKRYPVRFVFYGHHHHYHYTDRDGIGYVMTNSAAEGAIDYPLAGNFDHFLLVSVRDQQVTFAPIKADAIEPPDAVAEVDNYDLFGLSRKLAPRRVALTAEDDTWRMRLTLTNPTQRRLRVYVSCASDDDRWRHEPAQIPLVDLGPDQRHDLTLTWTARHSEHTPQCTLAVPFQTHNGKWIQYTKTVRTHIED